MENPYFTYQRVCINVFKTSANIFCLILAVLFSHNLAAATFTKIVFNRIEQEHTIDEYRVMICVDSKIVSCCEFSASSQEVLLDPKQCTKAFDVLSAKKPLQIKYVTAMQKKNSIYFYPATKIKRISAANQIFHINLKY